MFYWFIRNILWVLFRIIFRIRTTGKEHLPKSGAFILCGNHLSALDPIVLAICTKRQLFFMGKKELFQVKIFGTALRAMGAFPVDRAATDMSAYRHALDVLKNDRSLVIFSQGTRMKDFEGAKSGAALFALKSGAPIVPVGIATSYRLFSSVNINFGPPIYMDEYADRKVRTELVEEVMATVVEKVTELAR